MIDALTQARESILRARNVIEAGVLAEALEGVGILNSCSVAIAQCNSLLYRLQPRETAPPLALGNDS